MPKTTAKRTPPKPLPAGLAPRSSSTIAASHNDVATPNSANAIGRRHEATSVRLLISGTFLTFQQIPNRLTGEFCLGDEADCSRCLDLISVAAGLPARRQ